MADGDRIPKVLVVDDEPNIRELVEVALKFHGCAVAVSASGKDALHQVGAYDPDLMILDAPSAIHLAYRPGVPLVSTVLHNGVPA